MFLEKSILKSLGLLVLIIALTFTFTACDSDSGDEVMIEEVEDIPVVEVPYGTSGEEVISNELPETADVELSSDETVTVNISWEVPDNYSGTPENAPETYTFKGDFSIEGEDLTGDLEVEVTVLEEGSFTEETVNISYNDLNLNDVETVTSSDKEIVAVENDPDNNQIVITSAGEGSDITITIENTEGNEATVVIDIAEDGTITETVEPYGTEKTEITDIAEIEGTPEDGETLTAGELTPADATADYKWQYKDGSDWEDLTDGESYTVDVEEDAVSEGDDVKMVATGTGDYYGEVESATVTIVAPETGSIKGNVKDSDTNDNIEGVTVELEVEGEIYSDTTNDNGDYTLENLPLGEHEVKAEHNNYDSATETAPIIENDGDTVTLDFTLSESGIDTVEIVSPTESDSVVIQSGTIVPVNYKVQDSNFKDATIIVDGGPDAEIFKESVDEGEGSVEVDTTGVSEGEYDITLTVTDLAGNEKSVEEIGAIVVEPSGDADLDLLEISVGELDPSFSAEITEYVVDVAEDIETVEVTAVLSDTDNASMTINGAEVTSGSGKTITLNESGESTVITIEVTAQNRDTKQYIISVDREAISVTGVSIVEENMELGEGETLQLTAEVEPADAHNQNVSWSSDNEAAVTIDNSGNLGAVSTSLLEADRTAVITASTEDGKYTDRITVTVTTHPEHFDFDDASGTIKDYDFVGGLDVVIPSEINGTEVTVIGEGAFSVLNHFGEDPLTGVIIPEGVKEIGSRAFDEADLNELKIPDSVEIIGNYAFSKNYNLTNLNLGNGLKSIEDYAFFRNPIENLVLPDSVRDIGYGAFKKCSLTNLELNGGLISIDTSAFSESNLEGSLVIPDSVVYIGRDAFYDNNIESLTLPENIIVISEKAFFSNNLTEITIPESTIEIDNFAFAGNHISIIHMEPDDMFGISDYVIYEDSNKFKECYLSRNGRGKYERQDDGDWEFTETY